jgi:hypothetical protein
MTTWYRFLDWLKTASGKYTRYGVSANGGTFEIHGFVTESQALAWIDARRLENCLVFRYDANQMAVPGLHRATSRPPPGGA